MLPKYIKSIQLSEWNKLTAPNIHRYPSNYMKFVQDTRVVSRIGYTCSLVSVVLYVCVHVCFSLHVPAILDALKQNQSIEANTPFAVCHNFGLIYLLRSIYETNSLPSFLTTNIFISFHDEFHQLSKLMLPSSTNSMDTMAVILLILDWPNRFRERQEKYWNSHTKAVLLDK